MERSRRPDPWKQPRYPLLLKTQTPTSKTKPDRQGATPISNLPEIPTHGPHTPAGDPKAKGQSSCQTRTQFKLLEQAQHDRWSSSHSTSDLSSPEPLRDQTRSAVGLGLAGRPCEPDSKHENPLQTLILMPQTSILMPQNLFLMPQNFFFGFKSKT
jgi:hypothetical protein